MTSVALFAPREAGGGAGHAIGDTLHRQRDRTDDEGLPLAAAIPLTALSILAGLVLLGLAVRQADALSERWRSLPLAMGRGRSHCCGRGDP